MSGNRICSWRRPDHTQYIRRDVHRRSAVVDGRMSSYLRCTVLRSQKESVMLLEMLRKFCYPELCSRGIDRSCALTVFNLTLNE